MLVVLDDVLNEPTRQSIVSYFLNSAEARNTHWLKKTEIGLTPLVSLVEVAARYFDTSSIAGCEYWAHYGTKPEWHIDKDELLMTRTGELSTPMFSMVYYAAVDELTGGKFMTETASITPIANRLVMFSSGVLHGVESYTGTRLAVAINPWDKKPEGY